jgi:hypothetical protein
MRWIVEETFAFFQFGDKRGYQKQALLSIRIAKRGE